MSNLLHRCMTKATTAEGDDIRHSLNWVVSRRGSLRVMDDALECGNWRIPYDKIDEAVLFNTRANFVIPCYVLRVKTEGKIYQFGLNPGKYWRGELPFSARREKLPLQFSWFSITVRVFLLISIGYLLWQRVR